jgi:hypothetical protein
LFAYVTEAAELLSAEKTTARSKNQQPASRQLFDLGDLAGDALPLATVQHPGVCETKRSVEWFAIFGGSLLPAGSDLDKQLKPATDLTKLQLAQNKFLKKAVKVYLE